MYNDFSQVMVIHTTLLYHKTTISGTDPNVELKITNTFIPLN